MRDEMKRGRSQVIWKYLPGAIYRFNDTGGWCKTNEVTLRDPSEPSAALCAALQQMLRRWNAIGPTSYPDPIAQPQKYAAGEPYQVWYSLWPTVFVCRKCGQARYYEDVKRLREVNDRLGCSNCRQQDVLRQVPFAYVCECGRLDSVYIPKHDHRTIELKDRGSFEESYWFCSTCGASLRRNSRAGLGFRSCECRSKKAKRGMILEDSRLYFSQTLSMVEIEPSTLERWKGNARFSDVLLGAFLGIDAYRSEHLLDLARWQPVAPELSPELRAMRDLLIQNGMPENQAEEMVRRGASLAGADPWAAYDRDLGPFRSKLGSRKWDESRQTVEYVFARDEPAAGSLPLSQIIKEATTADAAETASRLRSEQELAAQLGISSLSMVQALPILLAGFGYTRYKATPEVDETADSDENNKPDPAVLRYFQVQNSKIPIYVARNNTEGILYDLDPWRLAAFLEINAKLPVPTDALRSEPAVRAWLLAQTPQLLDAGESHLVLRSFEEAAGLEVELPSALTFGVLHTLSHVLKATAHRYVGIDGDALAEYLFPAHQSGLLYVSSNVQFTLGGIDSVFRANLTQWLGSARDYAGRCSFDPVCSDSGGACSACLYPKFGCAHFNRTLSRAFLFGGNVRGLTEPLIGFWEPSIVQRAEQMKVRATSV